MSEILTVNQELSATAAKKVREMIIDKGLKAGDRLPNETELGITFGVSRSTVREAVKLLTAENVVEIRRGRGTFVADQPGVGKDPLGLEFTDQSSLFDNLMETRMMIEPQIAYLAAQRATMENIQKLGDIIEKIHREAAKGNRATFDIAFHTAVAECTQNDVLHRILPIICESIHEGYMKTADVPGSYERSIQSHRKIYQAIVNKDSQTAKNETEKHLRQTQEDFKNYLGGKT